jgi:hypothetical protein
LFTNSFFCFDLSRLNLQSMNRSIRKNRPVLESPIVSRINYTLSQSANLRMLCSLFCTYRPRWHLSRFESIGLCASKVDQNNSSFLIRSSNQKTDRLLIWSKIDLANNYTPLKAKCDRGKDSTRPKSCSSDATAVRHNDDIDRITNS